MVILLFLVPALLLYAYSNRTSVSVVEKLIHDSTSKQLTFFSGQVENAVNRLSDFTVNMTQDPNVREFMGYSFIRTDYEEVRLQASILEKLELNNIASTWPSLTTVYSLLENKALTGSSITSFNPSQLKGLVTNNDWVMRYDYDNNRNYFYYYSTIPAVYDKFEDLHAVIEVKFAQDNIENMLDQFESASNGQVFLYSAETGRMIAAKKGSSSEAENLKQQLYQRGIDDNGKIRVNLNHASYELYYEQVPSLGWYVVEYVPVENILQPIRSNQSQFFATMFLLLAVAIVLALLLYRTVQQPILKLIRNIERVKQGNYVVTTLHGRRNDEFQYLFDRFNEMTLEIRQLIEKVYEEQLRSRDATLKQLQSQINPHFLYNCLGFIMNMTKLKKHEDVEMMTYHLSQYYRYVTRLETKTVPVSTEMEFTRHYLKITQLRFVKIHMEYDIPDDVKSLMIPKLLIQPIIENAIKHGIEATGEPVCLWIRATHHNGEIQIMIEDNGVGITADKIEAIMERMQQPLSNDVGTGLWNINQRLIMHFGEGAGIELFESKALGGLQVVLRWKDTGSEADNHV
ncbi:two-component sensor histidine kinase [Paenibacillus sp. JCM 10914]|nr:two-component sensor histidine kinase [Paenibacillus sp. JCM 10914]